jgi:hypothetical protein
MRSRLQLEEAALLFECVTSRPRIKALVFVYGYFDESGTNDQRPVMAMAGWVIDPKRLPAFNKDWLKVLRRYGVQEAKGALLAAALEHRERHPSSFSGWDQSRANEYRYELNQAIDRHMRFGIFTAVVKADYDAVMGPYTNRSNPLGDAYRWLMQQSLEHLVTRSVQPAGARLGPWDHAKVIFDRGHPKPGVTETYFLTITTDPSYEIAQSGRIVGAYNAADSSQVPALQAADHLVWGTNRGMEEVVKGLSKPGKVLGVGIFGLKRVPVVAGYWCTENLMVARKKLIGE